MLSSRPIDVDEKPAVGPRSMSQIMFKAKSALRMPCTLCTVVGLVRSLGSVSLIANRMCKCMM